MEDSVAESKCEDNEKKMDETFESEMNNCPYFPNQRKVDDGIRDLSLIKTRVELLTARLNKWNFLEKDYRLTVYMKHHEEFDVYLDTSKDLCFC